MIDLLQAGLFAKQHVLVRADWLQSALMRRIESLD